MASALARRPAPKDHSEEQKGHFCAWPDWSVSSVCNTTRWPPTWSFVLTGIISYSKSCQAALSWHRLWVLPEWDSLKEKGRTWCSFTTVLQKLDEAFLQIFLQVKGFPVLEADWSLHAFWWAEIQQDIWS